MLKNLPLLAISAVSAFAMHTVELNINEKDLEGQLRIDMGQFNDSVMTDSVFLGVMLLHGSEDHSDVDPKTLIELNFLFQRTISATDDALTLGMGVKLDYTQLQHKHYKQQDYFAMPIGIEGNYRLPFDIAIPLHVGGSFYYAPEVLSFNDAKNYLEYRAYFDVEIIEGGKIRLGYRNIDTDTKSYNTNYNHSAYVGFKMAF